MRRLLLSLPLLLATSSAWAACGVSSVQVKDNTGATPSYGAVSDGTNCAGETALVFGGAILGLGQAAMASSLPVAIASNQSAVPASQSGTWNINNISGTISLPTGAATSAKQPALGTAGSASTDVLTVQGIASMTKLLVTPDANSAVNVAQFGGSNVVTGTGAGGSGIPRVTLSNDSSLAANQSTNVAQINGVTPLMGNGVTGTGSPRATLSSDNTAIANWGHVATGAAPPTGSTYVSTLQSGATGGHVGGIIQCDKQVTKHITTATDTLAVQGVASQTIYVCGVEPKFAGSAAQAVFLENTASANANCSSANTQIAGTYTGSASTPTYPGFYNPFWGGLKNTSGNGLCINSTGTGPVDVDVFYTQF